MTEAFITDNGAERIEFPGGQWADTELCSPGLGCRALQCQHRAQPAPKPSSVCLGSSVSSLPPHRPHSPESPSTSLRGHRHHVHPSKPQAETFRKVRLWTSSRRPPSSQLRSPAKAAQCPVGAAGALRAGRAVELCRKHNTNQEVVLAQAHPEQPANARITLTLF